MNDPAQSPLKVLVLDEEEEIVQVYSELLDIFGFQTFATCEVEKAEKAIDAGVPFGILIFEIHHRFLKAENFVRKFRQKFPQSCIIALSKKNDPETASLAAGLKVDKLIYKPFHAVDYILSEEFRSFVKVTPVQ